ncbi:hypothetical protein [Clostridium sp. C2-6-12]|uniref:hypothetical protein n=1 Tax=Clostridium sp. C2-6-12 TaxID=2698832 RepID=UPI00136EE0D6|nr:hypothetical protein [Clostridium sp. C2-6-12]
MFSFEDLVSGVEGAISDVADAVSDAVDYASDAVSDAVDYVSDAIDYVSEEVSEAVDYVSDEISDAVDYVSDEVSDVVDYVSSEVSEAVDYVSDVADEVSDAVLGATSTIADACEDWASDAEEFFEENYKAVVGAFIATFSSDSSGGESNWNDHSSNEDINSLPEYDPISARLKENKKTRAKKKGANGEYFAGTIDDLGNFIPDDIDGFSDDGYEAYKKSMYDYAKEHKTTDGAYAMDWQVDAYNVHNGPWKYKFKALWDYFDDRWPVSDTFAQMYEQSSINQGFDPEESKVWAKIYGGFSSGMLLENGITQSIVGFKSFNKGFSYEDDIIIGSGAGNIKKAGSKNSSLNDFEAETATTKQKGNFGEFKSNNNLLNNQSIKDAGYDLKLVGREAPSGLDDKIIKGIDGLYENTNADSNIKYVIDEAKFGSSKLGKTNDGLQMSDDWIKGSDRIRKAVNGDKDLADDILEALDNGQVERVLSKIDSNGNVVTYKLDSDGKIIGIWP